MNTKSWVGTVLEYVLLDEGVAKVLTRGVAHVVR